MVPARRFIPVILGLCGLLACGKGDPVAEFCELQQSCNCTPPPYATIEACVDGLEDLSKVYEDQAMADGLTFNRSCLEQGLSTITSQAQCKSDFEGDEASCSSGCNVVHGTVTAGGTCVTKNFVFSNCANNLFCNEGICVDPCKTLAAGEACDGPGIAECAKGLFCDDNNTKTCQSEIDVGGPCPTFDGCKSGLYCGDDMTCKAPPKEGEACTVICDTGLICDTGTCKLGPGEGEPCSVGGQCGPGFECDDDDLCQAETALVCNITFTDPSSP